MPLTRRTVLAAGALAPAARLPRPAADPGLAPLAEGLLKDWCDGLLRLQIDDRARRDQHGAFRCPACRLLHGRCGDAVYPLLRMARSSGQARYLDGAVRVVDWMKNVDAPDGAWTNEPNAPDSWKGITVFGAIALGEGLRHHGELLDRAVKERWSTRLRAAARFIHDTLAIGYANINYPVTAAYALTLLGQLFDEPRWRARGRALAHEALPFLTPGKLLTGEGQPQTRRSPKGLLPVDLGYNVEESLPALAQYGLLAGDEEVLEATTAALAAHLEFMLPDGGWDNSWGTRNFKWTYWGSRTTDGCQPGYALLGDRHPAFAAAALRNTRLLRACTALGLLHGGPHAAGRGVPACVHHTFCHAKALAAVLDHRDRLPDPGAPAWSAPLPRETARGLRRLPELDLMLVARGPWRATISGYDWLYKKEVFSGMGGALSLLWHRTLGPLLCASLTRYRQVEPTNMQPAPDGPDYCLTPRLEAWVDGQWYSHLFHPGAKLGVEDGDCVVEARLVNARQEDPPGGPLPCRLRYRFTDLSITVEGQLSAAAPVPVALVLPVIATDGEALRRISSRKVELKKPAGMLVIEGAGPVDLAELGGQRVFNLVPGFCAAPVRVRQPPGERGVACTLHVRPSGAR